MENYKRVASSRTDAPSPMRQNEIRITAQGLSGSYVSYAISLFQVNDVSEVVLTAMGRVISKAVLVAEILKKKIRGLHQNISLASSDVKDVWEPLEEGLNTLEMVRHVSMISITLSTKELDVASYGYQPPAVTTKQVRPLSDLNREEGRNSGGSRTYGRGKDLEKRNMRHDATDENWNPGRGDYGATRGRGYGGGRGYYRGQGQGDTRSFNRGFATSYPQANTRGYNRGNSQPDARGYVNASLQVNSRGQNQYYPQAGTRKYSDGNAQINVRRYNQTQADIRGYNGQRGLQQYSDGRLQGGNGNMYNQSLNFRGQGGGVWGRGRGGRYGR